MPTETTATMPDYAELALALGIDLVAITLFAIAIYFRRHTRKDLAVVFAFFNICLFVVVKVIQMTEVAAALGFGLFAILSIIRLRSEPFSNREIGYFFGALVLGLVNGIGTPHLALTLGLNVLVVVAIFVLDHPRVLATAERRHITLDAVHTDPEALRQFLAARLGATITECTITSIDFVRDSMELEVQYVEHPVMTPMATVGAHRGRTS
ncbi:DUF4956 domain-containing protein [soil metagenome]